jgi:hypothetical protein
MSRSFQLPFSSEDVLLGKKKKEKNQCSAQFTLSLPLPYVHLPGNYVVLSSSHHQSSLHLLIYFHGRNEPWRWGSRVGGILFILLRPHSYPCRPPAPSSSVYSLLCCSPSSLEKLLRPSGLSASAGHRLRQHHASRSRGACSSMLMCLLIHPLNMDFC